MIDALRKALSPVKFWLAKPFVVMKVSPDSLTLWGVFLAICAAVFLWLESHGVASGCALAAVLMDFIDGEVARQRTMASARGNFLEAIADKLVEFALALGFYWTAPWLTVYAIAVTGLIALLKARVGLVIITDNHDWPGFGDHAVRSVGLVILYGLLYVGWVPVFYCVSGLFMVLTLNTAWVRYRYAQSLIAQGMLLPYLCEDESARE